MRGINIIAGDFTSIMRGVMTEGTALKEFY